jgi:hypothetical protein
MRTWRMPGRGRLAMVAPLVVLKLRAHPAWVIRVTLPAVAFVGEQPHVEAACLIPWRW